MATLNSLSRQYLVQISPQQALHQSDVKQGKYTSQVVNNLARVKNSPDRFCKQEDFLADLKSALMNRKKEGEGSDKKPVDQQQKPWQRELTEQKEAYARSEPERKAAEAKEDARVRVALKAEEVDKAKLKAAEAEKANRPVVPLKLDGKGVPLPPPPPVNIPAKILNNSNVVGKSNVHHVKRQQVEMKNRQADLMKDLASTLAKRAGKTSSGTKSIVETLKPWQQELAKSKLDYEKLAPERKIAESQEDTRVTMALNAEAAEKAKMKAAEAEKNNKPIAALTLDAKGIPLPPPPPPLGRFKSV